jgi:hypothetical protein
MNNIINMEQEFEKKMLEDEIERLKNENTKLRILLKDSGMESDITDVSDQEALCVQEISKLKKLSDDRQLCQEEVKNFDLLNKNLQLIRGNLKRGAKSKLSKMSNDELKKLVK